MFPEFDVRLLTSMFIVYLSINCARLINRYVGHNWKILVQASELPV